MKNYGCFKIALAIQIVENDEQQPLIVKITIMIVVNLIVWNEWGTRPIYRESVR